MKAKKVTQKEYPQMIINKYYVNKRNEIVYIVSMEEDGMFYDTHGNAYDSYGRFEGDVGSPKTLIAYIMLGKPEFVTPTIVQSTVDYITTLPNASGRRKK